MGVIIDTVAADSALNVAGTVPVLVNGCAGTADGSQGLRALFERQGVDAEIFILGSEQFHSALLRVRREGPPVVFVGGGDGTVRLAASMLYKTDTALGVLPLGTLNHFAKDLEIPAPIEEAVTALLSGRIEHIDIGSVNGHIFVNNACLGIYPEAVKMRTRIMANLGFSKYVAMTLALFSSLRRLPSYELMLMEKGVAGRIRSPFLFVGNNLYTPDLFATVKRESLTDGLFSLFYADRTTRLELFGLAVRTLFGVLREAPKMEMRTVKEIRIASRKRVIEAALDGEVLRLAPPLIFQLLPRTLKVILPGNLS